jgi:ribokinase
MRAGGVRVAVVGHVEWVQFARVRHVPSAGEVVHAWDAFEEPAGGGAVAAVQLARLAGAAALITALGDDDHGRRAAARLRELGVAVHASSSAEPTRRAVTLVDDARERTITTLGARLEPDHEVSAAAWAALGEADGVYFTAGDGDALRAARDAASVLVASPRAGAALEHGVRLDALVLSGEDPIELRAAPRAEQASDLVVMTEGPQGGRYRRRSGDPGRWPALALDAEPVDSYGCGDSFAAGFTFGLASGMALADALALGARCGATCLTGRGPYTRQLRGEQL